MSNSIAFTSEDLSYLLSPQAIRDRARQLYQAALGGKTHFRVHEDKIPAVAQYVTEVTLKNYPKLEIPFHSRWGHFQIGGVDRLREFNDRIKGLSREEKVRAQIDLVIVSVLLDAGSGPGWKYFEAETGKTLDRSEGLAVASFRMFMAGEFSSDPAQPLRADGKKLGSLKADALVRGFQVSDKNPLAGVEGRLGLLNSLGRVVQEDREHFPGARPGGLADFCRTQAQGGHFAAPKLLLAVLQGLGPIWPGRIQLGKTHLGDVWSHPLLGDASSVRSLIPFHKLSQWLTYSLIEPLIESGLTIDGVEELTGLAEYRNGGLLLDRGLIELRDPALLSQKHRPDSALIIEWRALTVVLLEKIAEQVRKELKMTEKALPLAKVLEGGTWWAGRKAAAELRSDGGPPIQVQSDGTVF